MPSQTATDLPHTLAPGSFYDGLAQTLRTRFDLVPPVDEPVLHLLSRPGKGLRPELSFAVAEACGTTNPPAVAAVAAAGELLHLASLIHDDMVDGAQRRRGTVAVHHAFDPVTAVLTGDYLMGAAYAYLSEEASEITLRRLGPAMHALATAELQEIRTRGRTDDLALAMRIARGKTGGLFAWIAAATAAECGEWAGQDAWSTWGEEVGVAFQLADDLGDMLAIEEGKDTGLDASTGTPTMAAALLHADADGHSLRAFARPLLQRLKTPPARGARLQQLTGALHARLETRIERAVSEKAAAPSQGNQKTTEPEG